MNDIDATNLAERITRAWRGTIGTEIWHEVLLELDHAPAEQAWKTLRDTEEHQPSIARFRSSYRAQFGTAHTPHIDCRTCGGDGWQTIDYDIKGRTYQGVKPCGCRNGRNTEDVHRRITDTNATELKHTGRTTDHDAIGPPPAFTRTHTTETP